MNAGKELAIGDYVFEFDTVDMDYDSEKIYEIYKEIVEDIKRG